MDRRTFEQRFVLVRPDAFKAIAAVQEYAYLKDGLYVGLSKMRMQPRLNNALAGLPQLFKSSDLSDYGIGSILDDFTWEGAKLLSEKLHGKLLTPAEYFCVLNACDDALGASLRRGEEWLDARVEVRQKSASLSMRACHAIEDVLTYAGCALGYPVGVLADEEPPLWVRRFSEKDEENAQRSNDKTLRTHETVMPDLKGARGYAITPGIEVSVPVLYRRSCSKSDRFTPGMVDPLTGLPVRLGEVGDYEYAPLQEAMNLSYHFRTRWTDKHVIRPVYRAVSSDSSPLIGEGENACEMRLCYTVENAEKLIRSGNSSREIIVSPSP